MKKILLLFLLCFFNKIMAVENNELKNLVIEKAFHNANGNLLVQFEDKLENKPLHPGFIGIDRYFYGTTEKLFQLHFTGAEEDKQKFSISFNDSRGKTGYFYGGIAPKDESIKLSTGYGAVCQTDGQILIDDYKPVENIVDLTTMIRNSIIPLEPLPKDVRRTEYIFKSAKGIYVYVDAPLYYPAYENFRLFTGTLGKMAEKKIVRPLENLFRSKIVLETDQGEALYTPPALVYPGQSDHGKWKGTGANDFIDLEPVDTKSFALPSLGIKGVPGSQSILHTPCDKFITPAH